MALQRGLKQRGVHVILSNSSAEFVRDLYQPSFTTTEVSATRLVNSKVTRRGAITELEGKARARNVIIEFPSMQHAVDCYHSPEYQIAAKIRQEVADAEMVVVEGA